MKITMACGPYDRAKPLIDGSVRPVGLELDIHLQEHPRQRQRDVVAGKYDVSEFYMGTYIADKAGATLGITAIPIFVKRMFRHSYIYIHRRNSGMRASDLSGKRIGIQSWFTTTAIWVKGILEDDYGVDLATVQWFSNFTERDANLTTPAWVDAQPVPPGASLHSLLVDGEIDAVITTEMWAPFEHPDIRFLFPNYGELERDYFRRTRNFPIMHVLVVRDALLEQYPWVAMSLFDAWQSAKLQTYEWLAWQRIHQSSMWFRELWEEEQALTSGDPYKWGFGETRHEVELLLEYSYRQGIVADRMKPEELFHPSTIST